MFSVAEITKRMTYDIVSPFKKLGRSLGTRLGKCIVEIRAIYNIRTSTLTGNEK